MYRSMWNRQPEAGVGCSTCDPVIPHDPNGYAFCAETCESFSGACSCHVGWGLVDHCLHRVVVVHCVLCVSCSVGVHICLSVHATDVNNPMNSVDMRGVSTPVLPVTVFSVMEPVVTAVTLGTACGCAVTESCCSPLCTTLTFLEVLCEASKT